MLHSLTNDPIDFKIVSSIDAISLMKCSFFFLGVDRKTQIHPKFTQIHLYLAHLKSNMLFLMFIW